jgi:hypothetical protein
MPTMTEVKIGDVTRYSAGTMDVKLIAPLQLGTEIVVRNSHSGELRFRDTVTRMRVHGRLKREARTGETVSIAVRGAAQRGDHVFVLKAGVTPPPNGPKPPPDGPRPLRPRPGKNPSKGPKRRRPAEPTQPKRRKPKKEDPEEPEAPEPPEDDGPSFPEPEPPEDNGPGSPGPEPAPTGPPGEGPDLPDPADFPADDPSDDDGGKGKASRGGRGGGRGGHRGKGGGVRG